MDPYGNVPSYRNAARLAARLHAVLMAHRADDTHVSLPVPVDRELTGRYEVTIMRSRPNLWQLTIRVGAHGIEEGVFAGRERAPSTDDQVFRLLDAVTDGMLSHVAHNNTVRLMPRPDGHADAIRVLGGRIHKWE